MPTFCVDAARPGGSVTESNRLTILAGRSRTIVELCRTQGTVTRGRSHRTAPLKAVPRDSEGAAPWVALELLWKLAILKSGSHGCDEPSGDLWPARTRTDGSLLAGEKSYVAE